MTWQNSPQILAINHAGEWGAIHFYRAQLQVARHLFPVAVPHLQQFLANEYQHLAIFDTLIAQRGSGYCRELWLWRYGGAMLGILTAMLGAKAAMAATLEFEKCVIQHLNAQLNYLQHHDHALHTAVTRIYQDELQHGAIAAPYLHKRAWLYAPVRWGVRVITEALMAISQRRYA